MKRTFMNSGWYIFSIPNHPNKDRVRDKHLTFLHQCAVQYKQSEYINEGFGTIDMLKGLTNVRCFYPSLYIPYSTPSVYFSNSILPHQYISPMSIFSLLYPCLFSFAFFRYVFIFDKVMVICSRQTRVIN